MNKKNHLDLPEQLKIVRNVDRKVSVQKHLDNLSKLYRAVNGFRLAKSSDGDIKIASDGALELYLNFPGTQFLCEYRQDNNGNYVVVGPDREKEGYGFVDVINYRYTKDGETVQEYDFWFEADSIEAEPFQYVYYEFSLLEETNNFGDNVKAVLKTSEDLPDNKETPGVRYVVLGMTGSVGEFFQFHRGEIELDFTTGGGSSFSFIQITDVDYSANNGAEGSPTYIYKVVTVSSIEESPIVPPTDPEELVAFEESKFEMKIVNGYPWNLQVGDNVIQIGSSWFQLGSYGSNWYLVAPMSFKCFQKAPNGSNGLQRASNGLQWAPNGSKWLQMAPNGSKWLQMAPNGSKWLQWAPNGSKWLQLAS